MDKIDEMIERVEELEHRLRWAMFIYRVKRVAMVLLLAGLLYLYFFR